METAGQELKKIRLGKGLSLEEVQKKTKIHLNILRAIEEDGLINFNPVYIKGFLKIYCKFLGVKPQDFISGYKEPEAGVRRVSVGNEKSPSVFQGISEKLTPFRQYITIRRVSSVILIIALVIILFNLGRRIAARRPVLPKKEQVIKINKAQAPKVVLKPQHTKEAAQKPDSGVIKVGVRAKDDCWIELKSDGRIIFQNILRKGRTEIWQAKDKIELSLGNAGAVDLEVNNKIIPPVGRKGQQVKNILITKEGLSIAR